MTTGTGGAAGRRDLAVIVLATLAVLGPSLFTRDPWNPDEPRYQEVARAMVVTGQYLVPHLNGELYPDKPPLAFWASAALYRLGFGLAASRAVSLLVTVGTLLVTYELGRRLYGREVGLLAALATLTCGLFLFISGFGVLDPPLTFFVVASIYCGVRAFEKPRAWWLGAYAAAALGILVKGPVALATPALVLLAYGLAHRRQVRAGGWWHLAGGLLVVGLVAAWLVPACVAGGRGYTNNILFQQTLRRVAKSESHRQPPWFYLVWSPALFFPWTLVLILALAAAVRAARRAGWGGASLELLWFAVVFVFFSAVSGKRERYLLPIVPAAGLLCARYVWAVAGGEVPLRGQRWLWRVTFLLVAVLGGALAASALMPQRWARAFRAEEADLTLLRERVTPGVAAVAVVGGVGLLLAAFRGSRLPRGAEGERGRALALVGSVLVLSLVLQVAAMPVLDRFKSGRYFVQEARPFLDQAEEVYLFESDLSGVYNLFTGRLSIPVLEESQELVRALKSDKRVAVMLRRSRKKTAAETMEHLGRGYLAASEGVGGRTMLLITNWKP